MSFKIASIAILAGFAAFSQAHISYDNFGPGDAYNFSVGYTIAGSASIPGAISQADQFTSLTSGTLVSVTTALMNAAGTNSGTIGLYNDSGDTIGTNITTWFFGPLPAFGNNLPPTVLNNAFPSITLTAGTKYWILADVQVQDTWDAQGINTTGATTLRAVSVGGGSFAYGTNSASALRVITAPVPEPATMAALGLGFAAMLRRKRRK